MWRRRAQDFDVASLDAETIQQPLHRELRMVRRGRRGEFALRVPDAADRLPGLVVQIGVEPRQHHRALLQAGDGVRNFAVAGIEPVEPAAITGPS